jgi:DNA ligase D-like protein (predicted polymerase)
MTPRGNAPALSDPEWQFELDFTGQRLLAGRDGRVGWWDAAGNAQALNLPAIEKGLEAVRSERFLMDGVLVASDEGGRPSRELLDHCLAVGDTAELAYYAFDLLYYEAWGLAGHPLSERKRALESIIPKGLPGLLYVDHVAGRGEELLAIVGASGLPGVIGKARESVYTPGPSSSWRRVAAAASDSGGRHVMDGLSEPGSERVIQTRSKLSNLDKVYWPAEGFTKGQLLEYYDRMADTLLPYLRDRPVHMLRYPEGIEGHAFYQKNVAELVPDWIPTVPIAEKDGEDVRYVVCNDRDTLLYLVNLGSIDLHPWISRTGSLDSPDYLVIDLDPSTDEFPPVVKIARELGKILRGIGMKPVLKTSGASGLHVHIAIRPGYTYEQARMFAELVARLVSKEHRDIATVERTVAKRGRKVYVDYLQNAREQTVVPPYVVRPKPGATVSAPLDWDELDEDLRRENFTIFTEPERVERLGDLYRGLLDDRHDLMEALERLQELL